MKRLTVGAWERFLAHRDEATLLAEIDSAPPWVDPYKPAYPSDDEGTDWTKYLP